MSSEATITDGNCSDVNELTSYGIIGESGFSYGNNSIINTNDIQDSGNTPTPTGYMQTVDLTFPPIDPDPFPSTGGSDLKPPSPPTIAPGSYGTIEFEAKGQNTTISFTGGDYYIYELTAKKGAFVELAPGNYFIEKLGLENQSEIIISPAGTVNIYIKESFQAGNQLHVNPTGDTGDLTVYLYDSASMQIGNANNGDSRLDFNGIIYSPYATSDIQFGNNNEITGAILSAGTVQVGNNTVFDYSASVQATVTDTLGCAVTGPDHYEVTLPSTSIACTSSTVVVTACADGSSPCSNPATDLPGATATLATSAGSLGSTTITFDATGTAATTLSYPAAPDGESVTVTLSGESASAVNARQCCPDGGSCSAADSCNTIFSRAGFIFLADSIQDAIGTQISGKWSDTAPGAQNIVLRAITTDPATGVCQGLFAGDTDVTIKLAAECRDPTTCADRQVSVANNSTVATIATNDDDGTTAASGYTDVPLRFGENSSAAIAFGYEDVGQIQLHAWYPQSGTGVIGASNTFVVRPDHFILSIPGNPAATDADGSFFAAAGAPFTVNVTAATTGGSPTPNYGRENGPEGVRLSHALVAPSGGSPGSLSGTTTIAGGDFIAGTATVADLAWSEVGIISLTAAVADGDYLGAGNVTSTSGNIGRFIPDHFAVSDFEDGALDQGCSGFTYSGQPIDRGLGPYLVGMEPRFRITAMGPSGATVNYRDADADPGTSSDNFAKLAAGGVTVAAPAEDAVQIGADGANSVTVTATVDTGTLVDDGAATDHGDGILEYTAANTDSFTYDHDANAIIAPFTANLDLEVTAIVDSDGVTATGLPQSMRTSGTEIRWGRLVAEDTYGSEFHDLPVPLYSQYFNGSTDGFVTNSDDSCTSVATGDLAVSPNLSGGSTTPTITNVPFAAGDAGLVFSAPENDGTVDVDVSASPWLQYDWDQDGLHDDHPPTARITFGSFRGNDRIIYWQEVFK